MFVLVFVLVSRSFSLFSRPLLLLLLYLLLLSHLTSFLSSSPLSFLFFSLLSRLVLLSFALPCLTQSPCPSVWKGSGVVEEQEEEAGRRVDTADSAPRTASHLEDGVAQGCFIMASLGVSTGIRRTPRVPRKRSRTCVGQEAMNNNLCLVLG